MNTTEPWVDPDDAPELDRAWFDKARLKVNGKEVKRPGRPVGSLAAHRKEQVTVRLDNVVLDKLREAGPGWQTRMNDMLRKALEV
jgi:uncharacterized protein (DUF4415 family)